MPSDTSSAVPACPVCATPWGLGPAPTVSCPHCGCALQVRESRFPVNALLIAGALLIPLASLLVVWRHDEAAILVTLILAPAMSLACGVVLGLRIGRSVPGKIALACLLPIFLCIGCELTLAVGCAWLRE